MYKKRIERLLSKTGCPVLVTSRENIFYLSGFTGEDSFIYVSENFLGIFTDTRFTLQAKSESPLFSVTDHDKYDKIEKILKDEKLFGIEEENMTVKEFSRFSKMAKPKPVSSILSEIRMVKDSLEIEKIREAQYLSEKAFSHMLENFTLGMTENDVAFMLEMYMRKNGASGVSFDTIVASGKNGAMPHATATDRVIERGDMVVIDFGCIKDGYCSDMTRTVGIGSVGSLEKEVYEICKLSHLEALTSLREGITGKEADSIARKVIEDSGYGEYFVHSLGHGVGLEVHEMPRARKKSDTVLKSGMTLTVEPGIYIPDKFGVRIEDLTVIEKDGAKTLNSVTKDLILL